MILVPVGQHDRLDVLLALAQVGEVRQHQVDAELVGRREAQARVDHDDPPVVLDDGHVLADLAEPAQRQDAEGAAQLDPLQEILGASRAARTSPLVLVRSTIGSRVPPTSVPEQLSAAFTDAASGATASAS